MLKSSTRYSNGHSFKDHYQERKLLISRSIIAFAVVVVMLCALLIRSWHLQVVKYEDYQTRSNDNRISIQPLPPKRGLIYDRNGILLAENRSIYSLEIIPEQVDDLEATLTRLLSTGLIEEKHKKKFLKDLRGQRRFKSIAIKSRLSEQEVARFSVDRFKFPGVRIEARLVRFYPFGAELVHALGYVGRINDRELGQIDQANYKATRHIGKVGLEKFYEDQLHGTIGFRRVEIDVQGRVIGKPLFEKPPVPGRNLRLSLDIRLQKVAAAAMGVDRGSVVAIDPRNGEVLALVSNPGYDPNEFVTGISTANFKKLMNSEDRPLFNRALRGLYSPGSTIKPHIGWIGLEKGLITPQSTVADPGYWVIPNEEERVYRDWNRRGHGLKVDLNMAIIESCDPYFYDLAYRMGIDTLSKNMLDFGFGQYTGIDMGEEVPGIMPSRQWKRDTRKIPWFPGETVITGIGQGYWIATPLQLANAIGQLGIGGTRYQLNLVNEYQVENEWVKVIPEPSEKQADFSNAANLSVVQRAMRRVTQFPRGTAKTAFKDSQYQSAGKTGTVQLVTQAEEKYDANKVAKRLRDNAVYVGYAPYDKPEIAVAIVVENAGHGGSEAAPIARQLLDEYFNNKKSDRMAAKMASEEKF
ncbi:penicillin-binding protein 2 [Aliikangiella coralliicola]|uniref:Peptidoglycan D,D-transpeptidase MrdA n=1 Tax=Aliikangiella coralliicola TaxID=2592383 RepID=A0A545U7J9_9GAMM|nr:penicillin-binding protein 2 [Aliikangiella coralliicola]TQV85445.1 penicillin-binding protein 2 [Aliikangiella coralliicola]